MNNVIRLNNIVHMVKINVNNLSNNKTIMCSMDTLEHLSDTYFNVYAQRNLDDGECIIQLESEFHNYINSYWYPRILTSHPKIFKNNFNFLGNNAPVEGWEYAPYHWCEWSQLPDIENVPRYEVCGKIAYVARIGYESITAKIKTNDPGIIKTLIEYNVQLIPR